MQTIHETFQGLHAVFGNRSYDCLDPNNRDFLKDYNKFNSRVWMLDRKLSAVLSRLEKLYQTLLNFFQGI